MKYGKKGIKSALFVGLICAVFIGASQAKADFILYGTAEAAIDFSNASQAFLPFDGFALIDRIEDADTGVVVWTPRSTGLVVNFSGFKNEVFSAVDQRLVISKLGKASLEVTPFGDPLNPTSTLLDFLGEVQGDISLLDIVGGGVGPEFDTGAFNDDHDAILTIQQEWGTFAPDMPGTGYCCGGEPMFWGPMELRLDGDAFKPGSLSNVPIPPAVWLLGSALLGLGFIRRRDKSP